MVTWQHRISTLRRSGLTLADIGARIGLSATAVCDIESGRTAAPRGNAALALDALYREQLQPAPRGPATMGAGQAPRRGRR